MMEGLNQSGQEEFIWAMRTSTYRESDSNLWKNRRSSIPFNSSEILKDKNTIDIDTRQTKVMASLVPDEVIFNVDDYSYRSYDACFLFGDVSGFTDLCEKYNEVGVSGPSRMTQVLNKYLGAMVQEVMSHCGDVLKFSGDAFLAVFKNAENETMRDAVHQALDCALVIQKSYGSYLTDVGIIIRVKLAISAGHVNFALIGDPQTSHYVVVGKPIWDVKGAESLCTAGDIVVAPAAWHYVNTSEYLYTEMLDGIHMKLTGVGPNWRSVQKQVRQQKLAESSNENLSEDTLSGDTLLSGSLTNQEANEEFLLRPAVNVAVRLNIKKDLRKFIIAPVMKSIDMDEPFEYLTEMRQAVVVFINVVSTKLEIRETVNLCDLSYKVVCSVVHPRKGCVNKVSLFDKDLMFVVIFGLRGLKDELECQIALRCAYECHLQINKLPYVLTTSIGVTTGKTYCGVFGHTLRREYTVISLIVNKAARLMVAYKNQVSCDRETFLHSKMEAKNFILQEPKPLKGITHPGPVYQFLEVEGTHAIKHKVNPCPLLGREDKLKLYKRILEKFVTTTGPKNTQYKGFIINGNARQGKTRLLDELIFTSPPTIPVHRFTLTIKDVNVPYQTIRLLFSTPIGLQVESPIKTKERKLLQVLKSVKVPDLICVLNTVFNVNYKNTDLFLKLNENVRNVARKKMIKQLAYAAFITNWVIAIDNIDFVDEESWEVLKAMLDLDVVFILATLGSDPNKLPHIAQAFLHDARLKNVALEQVDRWYLGALACQILEVYAIPPELEKVLQTISHGNPGWIESFLISLIQDEGLYIIMANYKQINDLGLVCPPLYLMTRMKKSETVKWKALMEERRKSKDSLLDEDFWKRYIDSCRDSFLNVTIREKIEHKVHPAQVAVCVLSPNFNIKDVEAELSLDVVIMKTFDSLNSYEQLLIKCSAILGNQFPRDMLVYVMSATKARVTALAVQKLFEIKVLTCAKGDFFDGATMILKERLLDPNDDSTIKCECRGIKIEEDCHDLPRYASCGYMQFRSAMFRNLTYSLLTDNQKKEFHYRAIRYLEKETRRCRSCGNGFFDRILGAKHDIDLLSERDRKRKDNQSGVSWDDVSVSRNISFHSLGQGSSKSRRFDEKSIASIPSSIAPESVTKTTKSPTRSFLGVTMINKLKNSYSLTRAFSTEDFTDCQCNLILTTTYSQLLDHCAGANDLSKLIDTITEYSYICIISCNLPLAMRILNEALNLITIQAKEKMENWWKLSLIRARIYILIGYTRIELGQYDVALRNLFLALDEYGIKFPRGCRKSLLTCGLEFKQCFGLYLFPRTLSKHMDHWEAIFANNLSECLSHLCTIFISRNRWADAELAAVWSLNKSLECFSNFKVICLSYTNMILVAQKQKKWGLCVALEVHALRLCHFKRARVEAEELKVVSRLYTAIFTSRILRQNMDQAVQIGYISLRLCTTLHAVKVILPLLPLMVQCLMIGKHTSNVISILQELDYFADEDTDNSGKVWYFALCMCFHMETGYNILPYEKCERFYQIEGENWIIIRDPDARKRYIVVMWLWCIRNEKWDAAALWCIKTKDFLILKEDDSITNKFTALYVLEGMILYLVCKMDKRNIKATYQAEMEIGSLIKTIEQAGKLTKIILPRLYHLKAYFRYVKVNDEKVQSLLEKAKNISTKFGNQMELAWIDHTTKAWSKNLPVTALEFWRDHAEADNLVNYRELEINAGKIGYFTLPTPMYL